MSIRNRAHSGSSRGDEAEYFLFIQGLSPQCRWQELKDVIRKIPPDGHIRQAHTDNDNGTGWGHITILNRRKAFDAYDYMYSHGWRGHSVRLTLVVKDEADPGSLRRVRGPEDSLIFSSPRFHPTANAYPQNPPLSSPLSPLPVRGSSNCGTSAPYSNLGAPPIPPIYQPALSAAPQSVVPLQQPINSSYNSYQPSALPGSQRLVQQTSAASHPTLQYRHKSATKCPVNKPLTPSSTQDTVAASPSSNEGRTLYLYNLPYTVNQQAIKEHLAPAGIVDRCLVKEDRQRSSKYKLTAVATLRTPQQAQTAINRFDRSLWMGYEIKVRLDRGPTASGPSSTSGVRASKHSTTTHAREDRREMREGPLVVNGSGPSMSGRQARADSDDESSCDEENTDLSRQACLLRA